MKVLRSLVVAGLLSAALGTAQGQQVVVISNPGLALGTDDVSDVYLGEKQLAGSVKIVAVDNGALQDAFLGKFLGVDAAKYRSAWAKKAFRDGLTAPALKGGDAEVVDFVKKTPGSVGYVKGPAPAGVNVVTQK